mgnify:CR=1 FL=1|tara:strand:+ start:136 stop:465 length:330 start_codon:yes stop_codon:yes gene_type:complete
MAKGKARIIVLGRSKDKSMQINTFLSEIFTQEIPAEYISLITLKYNDGTKREIDQIENDIILDDLNDFFSQQDVDAVVEEVEIIVELDTIHQNIGDQVNNILSKHFKEE